MKHETPKPYELLIATLIAFTIGLSSGFLFGVKKARASYIETVAEQAAAIRKLNALFDRYGKMGVGIPSQTPTPADKS